MGSVKTALASGLTSSLTRGWAPFETPARSRTEFSGFRSRSSAGSRHQWTQTKASRVERNELTQGLEQPGDSSAMRDPGAGSSSLALVDAHDVAMVANPELAESECTQASSPFRPRERLPGHPRRIDARRKRQARPLVPDSQASRLGTAPGCLLVQAAEARVPTHGALGLACWPGRSRLVVSVHSVRDRVDPCFSRRPPASEKLVFAVEAESIVRCTPAGRARRSRRPRGDALLTSKCNRSASWVRADAWRSADEASIFCRASGARSKQISGSTPPE